MLFDRPDTYNYHLHQVEIHSQKYSQYRPQHQRLGFGAPFLKATPILAPK